MKNNIILGNETITVNLSHRGNILSIHNHRSGVLYEFKQNSISAIADIGEFCSDDVDPSNVKVTSNSYAEFTYNNRFCEYTIKYVLNQDKFYIERYICINPKQKITLYCVRNNIVFNLTPDEVIDYKTFWNCPTVVFIRKECKGLFCGFANPYFETTYRKENLAISFEPALILDAGEIYESDSNFFGVYKLSGHMIEEEIPKTSINYNGVNHPRYRNPSGYIPLDRNEIRSFKQFAEDYLQLKVNSFKLIFYNYFFPLPQQPETDEEEQIYYRYIDNFVELGGDIIIFNPLVRQRPPVSDKNSFWEIAPEGSRAERIIRYAIEKGLKYGVYMGSAPDNSHYCNSPMNDFASTAERSLWKKIGKNGEISRENCIACDSFAQWYYEVQKNTIEKYKMSLWNWDPGPGNGFFCYSAEHGHIPGKGAYKGFRNAMEVVKKLKNNFKDLYIQGFHGTKEYGLWGLRYFDQHEAYWEQRPYGMAAIYPDVSEDRLTASGMRQQSWWCQNFRFLPAVTNHCLAHRMTQYCKSPQEWRYLFDHLGWKYAFMSALAAGGSMTLPFIPYDLSNVYGKDYKEFFHKWIGWARENFEYSKHTVAFGRQAVCGGIDGYAKIIGDHGYLFLCNPSPIKCEITFELGEEIGLNHSGKYLLKQLYPNEDIYYFDYKNGNGIFEYNEKVSVTVPQYEVMLFELMPYKKRDVIVFCINGKPTIENGEIRVEGSQYRAGECVKASIYVEDKNTVSKIYVNNTEVSFSTKSYAEGQLHTFFVNYGNMTYPRYIYDWTTEDGKRFECPNSKEEADARIKTTFHAYSHIRDLLNEAVPDTVEYEQEVIEKLKDNVEHNLGHRVVRNNLIWATPYRLFFVLPFFDSSKVGDISIKINAVQYDLEIVKVEHYGQQTPFISYLDITDIVQWNMDNEIELTIGNLLANQFLGGYLYYPPSPKTCQVFHASETPVTPVVSDRMPAARSLRPWYLCKEKTVSIDAAWIGEGFIEEFKEYTLYAYVNYPSEMLEGVYASAQISIDRETGYTLKSDEKLEYDPSRKLWKRTLKMGNRQLLIIDCDYIHVWAVTKDGFVSPAYKVKVEWQLP